MGSKLSPLFGLAGALALSACGSVAPAPSAFQARAPLAAIDTDQSPGLRCLGRLIEAAPRGPVEVVVGQVRDRTVPVEFRDRRLSKGGEWWVHTAIVRLGTSKVTSLERGRRSEPVRSGQLLFEGAWTQDDRVGVEGESELAAVIGNVGFSLFGGVEYDLIVGDFTTARNGRVVHASAVGAVISAGSGEGELFVRDGRDSFAFDLEGGVTEGPQMAQRQITEAAVAAHLAAYYGVDFSTCVIETSRGSPAEASYDSLSPGEQHRALQTALKSLGHYDGKIDGIWGPRSAAALQRFAAKAKLPAAGRPTAALYRAARDAAARGKPGA